MAGQPNFPSAESATLRRLRGFLLTLFFLEALGVGAELLLLSHWEDAWQLVPLALLGASLVTLIGCVVLRNRTSLRLFQLVMILVMLSGCLGVWLHYDGRAEFRTEIDPSLVGWALFRATMTGATTPPVLAPAVMIQIGCLGLAAVYRQPAATRVGA